MEWCLGMMVVQCKRPRHVEKHEYVNPAIAVEGSHDVLLHDFYWHGMHMGCERLSSWLTEKKGFVAQRVQSIVREDADSASCA